VKIIDIHTHMASQFGDASKLARTLEVAARFDIQWLCSSMGSAFQEQPTARQIRRANDQTLALMRRWPGRIIGFCYLNPNLGGSVAELDRCVEAGMRGVKLWIAALCDEPQVFPIVERAGEYDIPVLQHTWLKTTGSDLRHESEARHLVRLARRYPGAKLIMAHTCGNWQYGIKAVRPWGNIFVDTSGGNPTQGYLEMAVGELGPKRILYGSDAPLRSFASQLAKVDGAAVSRRNRSLILHGNAAKLLKLGDTRLQTESS